MIWAYAVIHILCGVLAFLLDTRWERVSWLRIPIGVCLLLGPILCVSLLLHKLISEADGEKLNRWRDSYHERHK